jgi:hypothetical protein
MNLLSRALALCAIASLAGGCDKPTTTEPTTTDTTIYTELFSGTLEANSSKFYSFSVVNPGTTKITLASVTATAGGPALSTVLGVGLGTPEGTGCAMSQSQQTSAALTSQLNADLEPFIYCVRIFDVGNVSGTINFAVRIVHP